MVQNALFTRTARYCNALYPYIENEMDYQKQLEIFEENADYRSDLTGEKVKKYIAAGRCLCLLPNLKSGGIFGVERTYNLEALMQLVRDAETWQTITFTHYSNGGQISASFDCEGMYDHRPWA